MESDTFYGINSFLSALSFLGVICNYPNSFLIQRSQNIVRNIFRYYCCFDLIVFNHSLRFRFKHIDRHGTNILNDRLNLIYLLICNLPCSSRELLTNIVCSRMVACILNQFTDIIHTHKAVIISILNRTLQYFIYYIIESNCKFFRNLFKLFFRQFFQFRLCRLDIIDTLKLICRRSSYCFNSIEASNILCISSLCQHGFHNILCRNFKMCILKTPSLSGCSERFFSISDSAILQQSFYKFIDPCSILLWINSLFDIPFHSIIVSNLFLFQCRLFCISNQTIDCFAKATNHT